MKKIRLEKIHVWEEKDVYGNGCQPGTGRDYCHDVNETFISVDQMLAYVDRFFCINIELEDMIKQQVEFPDANGRFFYEMHVDEDGMKPDDWDLKLWRKGEKELYLATYFFYVSIVEETKDAGELEKFLMAEMDTDFLTHEIN